jgi:hypothetical protein
MNDEETVEAFISKYALSAGIISVTGQVSSEEPGVLRVKNGKQLGERHWQGKRLAFREEGVTWHRTWDEAKARAEEMRAREIAKNLRRVKWLESLRFERELK